MRTSLKLLDLEEVPELWKRRQVPPNREFCRLPRASQSDGDDAVGSSDNGWGALRCVI